jgi:hypothetical protein
MINAGQSKAHSKIDKIEGTPKKIYDLNESYAKLNEVREAYDGIVVDVSERSRLLDELECLASTRARGNDKRTSQVVAGIEQLEQLQVRMNRIKEMTDTVIRIESIHEGILVYL